MRIGITGHRTLPEPAAWDWVRDQLEVFLRRCDRPLIGITSLAIGADQSFGEIVLEQGGDLTVVIPFANYERTFADEPDLNRYKSLLRSAKYSELQTHCLTDDECYLKAGERVADLSDVLIAVWDGQPSRGVGGTADIVAHASSTRKSLFLIDPLLYKTKFHSGADNHGQ